MTESVLPDSGSRTVYPTGAQRDNGEGKGMPELISPFAILRLGKHMELGAAKYSARNWEKGMPLGRYIGAILRHTMQILIGDKLEDHAAAVMFNIMAFIHTQEMVKRGILPEDLDDLPGYTSPSVEFTFITQENGH